MTSKREHKHYKPALVFQVLDGDTEYDAILEMVGFDEPETIDAEFGAWVYEDPVLEGATVLAGVYQEGTTGRWGDFFDYIFLLPDGRLAWPGTLDGMILLTKRTDWTGCEASMVIANCFQTLEAKRSQS